VCTFVDGECVHFEEGKSETIKRWKKNDKSNVYGSTVSSVGEKNDSIPP